MIEQIFGHQSEELAQVLKIYETAFPENEKQDFDTIIQRINDQREQLFVFKKEDEVLAFALLFRLNSKDFLLLDYLAIKASNRRQGLGGIMLDQLKQLAATQNRSLLLEVDDPDFGEDRGLKIKRVLFYKKNQAKTISHFTYILPALSGTEPSIQKLMVISNLQINQIEKSDLLDLIEILYEEVYSRGEEDENFVKMSKQIKEHSGLFFVLE